MRRLLAIGVVTAGALGALACAAAVGLGGWTAVRTADRVTRVAARLDKGFSEVDAGLERVQGRLATVRADLAETLAGAEKLAAENPELPRVRSAIERLLDRLVPTIGRATALADSLRTVAALLRAAEEVVTELGGDIEQPSRSRSAADAIDRAAEVLDVQHSRVDAVKSAAAVRLTRELVELARDAAAGSSRLSDGVSDARRAVAVARERVGVWRTRVVFWVRVAASANTLMWLWIMLGQLCLLGWGRRRFVGRVPKTGDQRPAGLA